MSTTNLSKVFVGNLSFKTTEGELSELFKDIGQVKTANIIARGNRSLGYGFVEFETEEIAKRAVEALNKKVLDQREINVELARPRDANAPRPASARGTRPAGVRGARGGGRGTRGTRGTRGRPYVRGRGARRGGRGGRGGIVEGAPRPPRGIRQPRRSLEGRAPSKTMLFVANLPYSLTPDGLKQVFGEFKVVDAHVIQNRLGRSKGFGFVELANEEEQQKALAAMNNKLVGERELTVKIALTEPKNEDGSPVASTGATTTAATPAAAAAPAAAPAPATNNADAKAQAPK